MRKYYLTFRMALRVLLADESSTIKKVIQLALSDFGVEVRSVPIGFDVLPVAKSFQPDIVFADVLLTKKSGYEVCSELKQDPETAHIPVVLMWSGFMEVDEAKIAESLANGRLEKPFDADGLRHLVKTLVQKTKSNPVSNYLSFPEMPDFDESVLESFPTIEEESAAEEPSSIDKRLEDTDYNIDLMKIESQRNSSFEQPAKKPLEKPLKIPIANPLERPPKIKVDNPPETSSERLFENPTDKTEEERDEGGWSHQDLTKFKLNLPPETLLPADTVDFASKFVIPRDDEEFSDAHFKATGDFEEVSFDHDDQNKDNEIGPDLTAPRHSASEILKPNLTEVVVSKAEKSVKEQMMETLKKGPSAAEPKLYSQGDMNPEMMENLIRQEAREVIETLCWKILPEIAERVVQEEINKILRNIEKSI